MAGIRSAGRPEAVLNRPVTSVSQAQRWALSTGPGISDRHLLDTLQEHWGLSGDLQHLYAERDLNARLRTAQGRQFLVKVSHPDTSLAQLDFQDRAILHIQRNAPMLPVPRLVRSHSQTFRVTARYGEEHLQLRVFSWLDGHALQLDQSPPGAAASTGKAVARLGKVLADCPGEGAPTDLPWDLQCLQELAPLVAALKSAPDRQRVEQVLKCHATELLPVLSRLPGQVIHNDLNPENILFDETGSNQITGLIDFGDMVMAPPICDLAVATAYLVNPNEAKPFERVLEAVHGYLKLQETDASVLAALPDLIACRQAMTLLIQGYRLSRGEDLDGALTATVERARARLEASFSGPGRLFHEAVAGL